MSATSTANRHGFTVPGITPADAQAVAARLQDRLNALNDLALTLKHVHWNVVGPNANIVATPVIATLDRVQDVVDAALGHRDSA